MNKKICIIIASSYDEIQKRRIIMKKAKKLVAVAMTLILTITCFSLGSHAAEKELTVSEIDSFDFCLMDAVKSTETDVVIDKDGVETVTVKIELDNERYGFDVWAAVKDAVTSSSCKQELFEKLADAADDAAQASPYISPTANVTETYRYGVEDHEGNDIFYATVTVEASWSRTEDFDAYIDSIDVELTGWADALTTYDVDITDSTATILFYNPLISSDCFLEANYSISNTGRMTHNYTYMP